MTDFIANRICTDSRPSVGNGDYESLEMRRRLRFTLSDNFNRRRCLTTTLTSIPASAGICSCDNKKSVIN